MDENRINFPLTSRSLSHTYTQHALYLSISLKSICVCLCVWERETERDIRYSVCVCAWERVLACVCKSIVKEWKNLLHLKFKSSFVKEQRMLFWCALIFYHWMGENRMNHIRGKSNKVFEVWKQANQNTLKGWWTKTKKEFGFKMQFQSFFSIRLKIWY